MYFAQASILHAGIIFNIGIKHILALPPQLLISSELYEDYHVNYSNLFLKTPIVGSTGLLRKKRIIGSCNYPNIYSFRGTVSFLYQKL